MKPTIEQILTAMANAPDFEVWSGGLQLAVIYFSPGASEHGELVIETADTDVVTGGQYFWDDFENATADGSVITLNDDTEIRLFKKVEVTFAYAIEAGEA